jgi:hypothetical protein
MQWGISYGIKIHGATGSPRSCFGNETACVNRIKKADILRKLQFFCTRSLVGIVMKGGPENSVILSFEG